MERNILLSIFMVVITIVSSFHEAEATSKLTCIDGFQRPTAEVMGQIENCRNQNGDEVNECVESCIDRVFGFLGDDGRPNKSLYWQWIDSDFFSQNQEIAREHMSECFAKYVDPIDPTDTSCAALKDFDDCGWKIESKMTC